MTKVEALARAWRERGHLLAKIDPLGQPRRLQPDLSLRAFEIEGAVPTGAALYGRACGWTLARAHARSGDRIAIAAYLGRGDPFDRAISEFAEAYADQNEQDHAALADAVESGRISAQTGI